MMMYIILHSAPCKNGEVRLVEGESEKEGRLEICFDHRWGTVSSDGWSETEAKVVCNDLGYELMNGKSFNIGTIIMHSTFFFSKANGYLPRPALSKPTYINTLRCSGRDLTLLDCSYKFNTRMNESDHSKDVGIQCKLCKQYCLFTLIH